MKISNLVNQLLEQLNNNEEAKKLIMDFAFNINYREEIRLLTLEQIKKGLAAIEFNDEIDIKNSLELSVITKFMDEFNNHLKSEKVINETKKIKSTKKHEREQSTSSAESSVAHTSKKLRLPLFFGSHKENQILHDTQEGILGQKEEYYEGLDFAQAKDDGNCFYYSIAAALNTKNKDSNQPKLSKDILRNQVADFYNKSPKEQENLKHVLIARELEKIDKEIQDTEDAISVTDFIEDEGEKQRTLKSLKEKLQDLKQQQSSDTKITNLNIQQYIEKIRVNEWADASTIGALSKILKRPIVVVEGSKNSAKIKFPIHGEIQPGDPIFVHYNGTNHYNALIVQPNHNGKEILKKLLADPGKNKGRARHD